MFDDSTRQTAQDQSEFGASLSGTGALSLDGPLARTVRSLAHGAPVLSSGHDMDATWYPGSWLTDPDGPHLHELVKIVADEWGGERHVAAALAFKGYAWAAVLPVLAGWLRHGCIPMLDSGALRVGIARRLPLVRFDLSALTVATPSSAPALADAARASLLDGHLREIITTLTTSTRIGRRLLWGSVAESAATVAIQLDGGDGARRALARLAAPLARLVEVRVSADDARAAPMPSSELCGADLADDAPSVRRRSCCLWFATDTGRGEYCASCPVWR